MTDKPTLGVGAALSEDAEVRATYWRQEAERQRKIIKQLQQKNQELTESRRSLFRKCNELQAEIAKLRSQ